MKILRWKRRSGKTTRLVDMLLDDHNAILVVFMHAEKLRIIDEIQARMHARDEYDFDHLEYLKTRVVTVEEGPKMKFQGTVVSKVLVDNVDMILGYICGRVPHTVTMSVQDNELEHMRPEHVSGGSRIITPEDHGEYRG